jgi:hypothetical protein
VFMKTHTGLGLGEVKIYYVGGVNDRWMYVVAGNAVEQLTSTVAQAESGQVVVSPQVWEVVKSYCVGATIEQPREPPMQSLNKRSSSPPLEVSKGSSSW